MPPGLALAIKSAVDSDRTPGRFLPTGSANVLLNDTGLLTHLLGVDTARLTADPRLGGGIFENLVALEPIKQRGWSQLRPAIHHFRTHNGEQVDLVLEDRAGRIVGVEVKASATIDSGRLS